MEFYGIEMKGKFILEILETTPEYENSDEGRVIYVEDEEKLLYGDSSNWVNIISSDSDITASLQDIIDGVEDKKYISPLKYAQIKATSSDVLAGSNDLKYITSLALRGLKASIVESQTGVDDIKYVTPAGLSSFAESNPGILPGTVIYYLKDSAPSGYLKANGAEISRTTYSDLFSVIGTTFGIGDGSTTFNLPDLRGRFIRSWSDDGSIDSGRLFGSFQNDELKSHSHSIRGWDRNIDGSGAEGDRSLATFVGLSNGFIGDTGGVETRPTNIALLACIKY